MKKSNIDVVDSHRPVEQGLGLFRKTDPETSKLAAKAAGSLVINHQRLIIDAISEESAKDNMGMTADEIAMATGMTLVQIARRTSDLESSGIIYKTGLTRKTRTGRIATVWRLVGH